MDAFHPIRHQHPGKKIAGRADRFEMCAKIILRNTGIERGNRADFLTRERCYHLAQVVRSDAHVAIGKRHKLVPRLHSHAGEFVHFAVRAKLFRANEEPNLTFGKFLHQPVNHRNGGVAGIVHRKKNFISRIILAAETGIVLIRSKIDAMHGLQNAYGRSKFRNVAGTFAREETPRRNGGKNVVGQRSNRR